LLFSSSLTSDPRCLLLCHAPADTCPFLVSFSLASTLLPPPSFPPSLPPPLIQMPIVPPGAKEIKGPVGPRPSAGQKAFKLQQAARKAAAKAKRVAAKAEKAAAKAARIEARKTNKK